MYLCTCIRHSIRLCSNISPSVGKLDTGETHYTRTRAARAHTHTHRGIYRVYGYVPIVRVVWFPSGKRAVRVFRLTPRRRLQIYTIIIIGYTLAPLPLCVEQIDSVSDVLVNYLHIFIAMRGH